MFITAVRKEATWKRPSQAKGLFRSYFLIILTHSRLHGANQQTRAYRAWKKGGKKGERARWLMLTFLTKGLFSAVVALVRQPPLWAKARYIISSPGSEKLQHHTELNGLPSWRADGSGEALMEITLNKIPWKILSEDATKESGATLPPATSGTSLSSLPIKRQKK